MLIPQWENGNDMQLEDIWEKIANNARLTSEELAFLKRSARETQLRNSFSGGMSNGNSNVNVGFIIADGGYFTIPPINSSWFGWAGLSGGSFPQDLTVSNTFQTISTGFTDVIVNPESFMQWYSQSTGKLAFSAAYAASSPRIFSLFGNVQFQSPSTAGVLKFSVRRKSDDVELTYGGLAGDSASADIGGINKSFSASFNLASLGVDPSSIYFQFEAKCTWGSGATRGVALDAMFYRAI